MLAQLIALVLPLGLDSFAVAAALGMIGVTPRTRLRVTILFTVFETGMPLIGLALGAPLGEAIGGAAQFVAIGVLLGFGLYTLLHHNEGEKERVAALAQARGPGMLLLGLSISLDELAIGFTLGLLDVSVPLVLAVIAVQTAVVAQLGLRLGNRLSERLRERAVRVAGAALTGLGLVLLAEKILA